MEGGQDPDCRRLMQFDPDPVNHELYRFIKTFLHLRKTYPVLANEGSWEWIPHDVLLMIKRNDLVLLINPSSQLVEIPLKGNILYTEKSSSHCSAYDIKLIQIG
jgi:hypothetical protein